MSDETYPWQPKEHPYAPGDWDERVFHAVRAFREGTATEGQQRLVWDWLMYITAAGERFGDISPRPGMDGPMWCYFVEGKRSVGLQFLKMFSSMAVNAVNAQRRHAAEAEARRASSHATTSRPYLHPRNRQR